MYYINPNIKNLERIYYPESRKSYLKLDMNENPDFISDDYRIEILKSITNEDFSMYPETDNLIRLLSSSINFSSENICITNGSDDAIRIIMQVLGKPNSDFVTVSPTFEMYSVYTKMYGLNLKSISFDNNFSINFDEFLNLIDENSSLVLLLHPNSPIGRVWSEDEVKKVIVKSKENNAVVVIDEAYFYFNDTTFINLIKDYDNLIVIRTFSKAFSIAGCRIGYMVTNKELSSILKKCISSYPVNILGIKSAEYLINNNIVLDNIIQKYKVGRDYIIKNLAKNNYIYSYNGGNYILIKPNKNPKYIFDNLKSKKILIKKYSHKVLSEWIRITIGSQEAMERFWYEFIEIDLN